MIPNVLTTKTECKTFWQSKGSPLVIVLEVKHIYKSALLAQYKKYGQILKMDFKIFRGIDHYNLSLFNLHIDLMTRNNMHSDSKYCLLIKTDHIKFWKIKGLT